MAAISSTAIIFSVNVLTSVLKRWVYPKWGKTGVQVVVFCLALIGAVYPSLSVQFPSLQLFISNAIVIFTIAIASYEVIWSRISWFKGKKVS